MRTKFVSYMIVSLLLLLFISCKKFTDNVDPTQDITGTWEWIFTYKAYPLSETNPLTPQNTGIVEIFIFNTDRTWLNIQNDLVIDSGTFSLGHGSRTPYLGAKTYIYDSIVYYWSGIQIDNGFDYYIIFNDTLEFSPGFSGRLTSYTLPYNGAKFWKKIKTLR